MLLIIFFTYFYTSLTFRADDVADNIKKQGGYIPGIRPGPADRRVHRARAQSDHVRRRGLPGGDLRDSDDGRQRS